MTSILDDTGDGRTAVEAPAAGRRAPRWDVGHPHYRWVTLSNTTLGMLIATVNSSIVLISLPAIFRGIGMNPLAPENVGYLLWMIMGYLLVSAVLVVSLGRLGDLVGRVRMYNLGFAVFTASSIALALTPGSGSGAALWIIGWRLVQAVGGSMLFANSTAILTDAFPAHRRGMALGINQIAAIAGSFLGLVLGGVLSEISWRSVFWVSVPIGVVGTVWSYHSLHELTVRRSAKVDWLGNATFAVGLSILLAGITYGIQPYGGRSTGWTSPWVLAGLVGGVVLLVLFCLVEAKVDEPMFRLGLFRNRAFALGNLAGLLSSMGRGGLQFMLIIWLQGIWLPLHGYSYESTPLWAGIYLLPLTVGFVASGPVSGWLSDRYGTRLFAGTGLLIVAATFVGLLLLPVDFDYAPFAILTFLNGVGSGMFASPNTAQIMNAVPPEDRGAAAGMRGTFFNAGSSLSIGVFFSLMIIGLAARLPTTLTSGLQAHGVPHQVAQQIGQLPPVGSLFAAFLGYNPIAELLGPTGALQQLPPRQATTLTGTTFFPQLISGPFHDGLVVVFVAATVMMLIAAVASFATGREEPARAKATREEQAPTRPRPPAPDPVLRVGEDRGMTSSGREAPAPDDAAARLYVVVGRLVRMLRRTGTADVSPGALSALSTLARSGPSRLGDLAAREAVAAPTMTRIVAVLEDAGLVSRKPDPADGRAVVVEATEAGTALVQGESFARSSALRRRVAALSASDRAALLAALPVLEGLARDDA